MANLGAGLLQQARNVDFDRTFELANNHQTVRQFLGQADWFAPEPVYTRRTISANVSLLTPALLATINLLVVQYGHDLLGQAADQNFVAWVDSLVVETDGHDPTDISLLWDRMMVLLRSVGRDDQQYRFEGWRHWLQKTYQLFQNVRQTRTAKRADVVADLRGCRDLVARRRQTYQVHGPLAANTCGPLARFI